MQSAYKNRATEGEKEEGKKEAEGKLEEKGEGEGDRDNFIALVHSQKADDLNRVGLKPELWMGDILSVFLNYLWETDEKWSSQT